MPTLVTIPIAGMVSLMGLDRFVVGNVAEAVARASTWARANTTVLGVFDDNVPANATAATTSNATVVAAHCHWRTGRAALPIVVM